MTRKKLKTGETRVIVKNRQLVAGLAGDAARVLYEELCNRRIVAGYSKADRERDGAAEYSAALDAIQPHLPKALLERLDRAHGNALAKTDEAAFIAGLSVGIGLAGGAR